MVAHFVWNLMVTQLELHIPVHSEESFSKKDKRITMARLENCLWNSSLINCPQKSVDSCNVWSPRPSETGAKWVLWQESDEIWVNHVFVLYIIQ